MAQLQLTMTALIAEMRHESDDSISLPDYGSVVPLSPSKLYAWADALEALVVVRHPQGHETEGEARTLLRMALNCETGWMKKAALLLAKAPVSPVLPQPEKEHDKDFARTGEPNAEPTVSFLHPPWE